MKCDFCHQEHDPTFKCDAKKQALRLISDWNRDEAAARRAAAAKAKAEKEAAKGDGSTSTKG